jgi:putative endonuclease
MHSGFVYIMTNRPNGTLQVGVTNDIALREYERWNGLRDELTKRCGQFSGRQPYQSSI